MLKILRYISHIRYSFICTDVVEWMTEEVWPEKISVLVIYKGGPLGFQPNLRNSGEIGWVNNSREIDIIYIL